MAATIGLALAAIGACGSDAAPIEPPTPTASTLAAPAPIHVTLELPRQTFAPDTEIRVEVWNEAQLALRERARACIVRRDGTYCLGDAPYTPPTPEIHTLRVRELTRSLRFDAASLRPGEHYELAVDVRDRDDCSQGRGTTRGIVASDALVTTNLRLATLERRCPAPRGITAPAAASASARDRRPPDRRRESGRARAR